MLEPDQSLAWASILITLAGGLALFLFGIEMMSDALKKIAGAGMKTLLAKMTRNRFTAAVTGAFVTAVLQSSTVTTVLVVGFISAGLLTLSQSVGIIMGANIGSTVTAQIIAFQITQAAYVLIAIGFFASVTVKRKRHRLYGTFVLGLGLLFLGMNLMSDATSPLRDYPPFIVLMERMANPLLGIIAGALFTAVVQSSAATMGVAIVLASQGLITLEAGIGLAFGANIGTCGTALLAAIGKPAEALQAAVAHGVFNVLGVILWVAFIPHLAELVRLSSGDVARELANAHTVFNVVNTLLFIGFTKQLADLVRRIAPERQREDAVIRPKFLDDVLIETPSLALERVRMELARVARLALQMVREMPSAISRGTEEDLDHLESLDDDVDALHGHIVEYLGRVAQQPTSTAEMGQIEDSLAIVNYIENIGDMIETNLVTLARDRLQKGLVLSESTRAVLQPLVRMVMQSAEDALESIDAEDLSRAAAVIDRKDEVTRLAHEARHHLLLRVTAQEANRLPTFRLEADLIENLRRLHYLARKIAKRLVERREASVADV